MLRLRWTADGGGRPTKQIPNQKEGRSEPTKHPPMAKLVSQEWNSNLILGVQCSESFSYPCLVQTGPLYRDIGAVISSITSPQGSRKPLSSEITSSTARNRYWRSTVPTCQIFQVLHVRPSVVWTMESSIPRRRPVKPSVDDLSIVQGGYRQ